MPSEADQPTGTQGTPLPDQAKAVKVIRDTALAILGGLLIFLNPGATPPKAHPAPQTVTVTAPYDQGHYP